MKKRIRNILLIVILGGVAAMAFVVLTRVSKAKEQQAKRSELPDFSFRRLDGTTQFGRQQLPAGLPVVFFYFDPDCEVCQTVAGSIFQLGAELEGTHLLMISGADSSRVGPYVREKGLTNLEGLTVLLDLKNAFFDAFGTATTPTLLFYDREGKLQKEFPGLVQPAGIQAALKDIKR